jgi:hypothetical protein
MEAGRMQGFRLTVTSMHAGKGTIAAFLGTGNDDM